MSPIDNMMTRQFLRAMVTVEGKGDAHNGVLDIIEVRNHAKMSKLQFDSTAIALLQEAVITLIPEENLSELTTAQRNLLVYRAGTQQYFSGIYRNR